MEEDLYERIGEADLNPTYKDGQVYQHTDINNMLSILKTAINENYYDIQRLENGEKTVGNANSLDGATLSRYLIEALQADDDKIPSSQQVKAYVDALFETYSPPIRGVDYWTEEDQEYVIDEAVERTIDTNLRWNPRGEYDGVTTYAKYDVVTYNGSSYVAKEETTGNLPTDTQYWELIASGQVPHIDEDNNIDKLNGYDLKDKKAIRYYDSVADMKADTSLKPGMHVKTSGYYASNDGGHAEYKIVNDNTLVADNGFIIELNNGLFAKLLFTDIKVNELGAYADGIHDDKDVLNYAINKALELECSVYLNGIYYVSETINTHGIRIVGDKQPTKSGAVYPNSIGWNYPKNSGAGASITFSQYIEDIVDGTSIISDIANPILSTDYNKPFNLENFGVYGWLRNTSQEGLLVNTQAGATYYRGDHNLKNFSVFNTGSNGIHLHSLESSTIDNLKIELTNGYGLYIEGLETTDCPTDYNIIQNSTFRYTRLAGIKIYHSLRQNNQFLHNNFNYIGQHGFGEVNDTYGTRTQPNNNEDIIYGIDIDGLNYLNPNNQGRNLELSFNFGEQINGLLKLTNIATTQGLTLYNNTIVKSVGSTNSVVYYLSTNYIYNLKIDSNLSNVEQIYDIKNLVNIVTNEFIPNQFINSIPATTRLFANDSRTGFKSNKTLINNELYNREYLIPYNSQIAFNTSSGSQQDVTCDISTYINRYFKDNLGTTEGQSYTLALLSLSHGGNNGTPPTSDLLTITKHHDKILIYNVTKNIATTVSNTGTITLTVPEWHIATIQFIQQVATDFGKGS